MPNVCHFEAGAFRLFCVPDRIYLSGGVGIVFYYLQSISHHTDQTHVEKEFIRAGGILKVLF